MDQTLGTMRPNPSMLELVQTGTIHALLDTVMISFLPANRQLSKIERGLLPPSVEVLLRLRERSGKSVDWILRGEE